MNLCETCKWWEPQDWAPDLLPEVQYGKSPGDAPGKWGNCGAVDFLGPSSPTDRFYVMDASAYQAYLHTRGDFGCVEWEAEEP